MLLVNGDSVLSQPAVQVSAAFSHPQPLNQSDSFPFWDIDGDGGAVDEMEALRYGAERKQFRFHQRENVLRVLGFCSLQVQEI